MINYYNSTISNKIKMDNKIAFFPSNNFLTILFNKCNLEYIVCSYCLFNKMNAFFYFRWSYIKKYIETYKVLSK